MATNAQIVAIDRVLVKRLIRGPEDSEPVTLTRTVRFAYRAPGEEW